MGKHVMITGATGMVGNLVLKQCIEEDTIEHITLISRSPHSTSHSKISEVIHENFSDYSSISNRFRDVDVAYFCLGAYTGAVPKDMFRKITVDFTKAFGRTLKKESPKAVLCFLSGQGADRSEKSRVQFARDKGEAENFLIGLRFNRLHIFRPAYIYPSTKRKEPNVFYAISSWLYPVIFKPLGSKYSITSVQLAKAMYLAGLNGCDLETLENKDILDFLKQ
jgi:uncharacterized protein YbjT (DUF2867 family)